MVQELVSVAAEALYSADTVLLQVGVGMAKPQVSQHPEPVHHTPKKPPYLPLLHNAPPSVLPAPEHPLMETFALQLHQSVLPGRIPECPAYMVIMGSVLEGGVRE